MTAFFRLKPILEEETWMIDATSHPEFRFTRGRRFNPDLKGPVLFELDRDLGGSVFPTLFFPKPVVRTTFLAELRRAGVANIDDYPVRIDGLSGGTTSDDYRAINIVGTVACLDTVRSDCENVEGMYLVSNLVIDSKRVADDALFFRVAEARENIIVTKKLADRLDLSAFPDVELLPIES